MEDIDVLSVRQSVPAKLLVKKSGPWQYSGRDNKKHPGRRHAHGVLWNGQRGSEAPT